MPSSDRRRMTPWSSGSRVAVSSTRSSDSSSSALAWASGSWAALPGSAASDPARRSTCSGLGSGSGIGWAPRVRGCSTPDSLASSASTRSAGAPKWSRAPPKATEQTTNQPKPRAAPPITSVSQCTPSSTLEAATATVMAAAPAASQALDRKGRPRPRTRTTAAQVAAAAAVCPEGKEKPLEGPRWGTGGRSRSTRALTELAIRFWPTTTVTRKASTARRRRRSHSHAPNAETTASTVTVAPSQVTSPSSQVEVGVALSAPQAAALASRRYRPVSEVTMSDTSPNPRAAAKTSPRATVRASPVAASGSSRRRRNLAALARNSSSPACSAAPWPPPTPRRPATRPATTATTAPSTPATRTRVVTGPSTGLQLPADGGAPELLGPHPQGPGPPGGQVELAGVVQVGQEVLLQPGGDGPVAQRQVELVVEGEGAVVEVDRPDGRPVGVHDHHLGVEHGPLVLEDAHPALQHPPVGEVAGPPHHLLVDVGAVGEHAHVDPAPDRLAQGLDERPPRGKVGGGQPDPLPGAGDGRVEQVLGVGRSLLGRAPGHLDLDAVVEAVDVGQVVGAGQDALGRLGPVVEEAAEQVAGGRALDPHVGVAPVAGILGVAGPLLGDPDPAGEPDPAVHDQDLAVGAVVELVQGVPLGRPEPGHLGPGPLQPVDQLPVHLGRAHGVEQDIDLDPGLGPLGQGLGELGGDAARPVHVGGEVDGPLGRPDRLQHGREDLAAVAQHRDPVALAQRGHGEGLDQAGEVGRARPRRVLQLEALAGGAVVLGRLEGVDAGQPQAADDGGPAPGADARHDHSSLSSTAVSHRAACDFPANRESKHGRRRSGVAEE